MRKKRNVFIIVAMVCLFLLIIVFTAKGFFHIAKKETEGERNITWQTSLEEYTYEGKTYEVETLIATADNEKSNLLERGYRVSYASGWKTSIINWLAQMRAEAVDTYILRNELSDSERVYHYLNNTVATFKRVKEKGMPDTEKKLTQVSTKSMTYVDYSNAYFIYEDGKPLPKFEQKNRTINTIPDAYNDTEAAVKSYAEGGKTQYNYADNIVITGEESKHVVKIHPLRPKTPEDIY